jgi:hypothetical protein
MAKVLGFECRPLRIQVAACHLHDQLEKFRVLQTDNEYWDRRVEPEPSHRHASAQMVSIAQAAPPSATSFNGCASYTQ